jgi:hypothetical protein
MSAVASINRTTSRSGPLLLLVKELFWLSVLYDFKLSASHIPGKLNTLSDKLSRLHNFEDAVDARILLVGKEVIVLCASHLSYATYVYLQEMWCLRWQH